MTPEPLRSDETPVHEPEGPEISVQDARQGRSGVRILLVLIVSALATATLLGLLWLFSHGGFQRVDAENKAETATATAPEAVSQPAAAPTGSP